MALYLGSNKKHKIFLKGTLCKVNTDIVKTNNNSSAKLGIAKLGQMKLGGVD